MQQVKIIFDSNKNRCTREENLPTFNCLTNESCTQKSIETFDQDSCFHECLKSNGIYIVNSFGLRNETLKKFHWKNDQEKANKCKQKCPLRSCTRSRFVKTYQEVKNLFSDQFNFNQLIELKLEPITFVYEQKCLLSVEFCFAFLANLFSIVFEIDLWTSWRNFFFLARRNVLNLKMQMFFKTLYWSVVSLLVTAFSFQTQNLIQEYSQRMVQSNYLVRFEQSIDSISFSFCHNFINSIENEFPNKTWTGNFPLHRVHEKLVSNDSLVPKIYLENIRLRVKTIRPFYYDSFFCIRMDLNSVTIFSNLLSQYPKAILTNRLYQTKVLFVFGVVPNHCKMCQFVDQFVNLKHQTYLLQKNFLFLCCKSNSSIWKRSNFRHLICLSV